MEEEKSNYFFLEYLRIVLRHKKSILIVTFLFFLIGIVLFYFVIDPVFYSSGTIKSSANSFNLSGLLNTSSIPDLGDISDLAGASSTTKELALFETILTSRRCLEETINKFGLMQQYEYKYMQDAVKDFKENILEIKKDKVAGTLEVGVYDKSPQKAKEITDFLIEQLNRINIELSVQNARENRMFIEQRYKITSDELKADEDSLQYFQDRYGIAPDVQVQAALKAEIELEAEIKSEEIKLDLLRKVLSPDQSEIVTQEEKIVLLKKQLDEMQNNSYEENKLNIKGSPKIILDFLRIKRNVEVQNKILSTLIPLLEKSKIDENKLTPTITILDSPVIAERKSKPKRVISILFISLLAFSFSSLYFIIREQLKQFYIKLRSQL